MTIRKGEPWGDEAGPAPSKTLATDAALALAASEGDEPVLATTGGDLHRTLGLSPQARAKPRWFPIDLGWVALDDGPEVPFAAHLVCRGRWFVGPGAVVMNAAWIGDRYLGPRAHPNDGLLDVTFGSLPPRQLLEAARRAKTGAHLPHPALSVRRVGEWEHRFASPRIVEIDGQPAGRATVVRCRVEPDRFTVVG